MEIRKNEKKIRFIVLSLFLLFVLCSCSSEKENVETIREETTEMKVEKKPENTNNADVMPLYVPDDKVELEISDEKGTLYTPDWVKSLIMVEVRIETATPEGTFEAAIALLDHYQEMGVNGLWLTPIYEKGVGGNGYGNLGLHRVDPGLTGTENQEEGWNVVKNFVEEAHKRNIRIILDVVTWGTMKGAPLLEEHPEFYSGGEAWGNLAFDWKSEALKEWFISHAVENIMKTGADGYRCDCEPNYAGYGVFATIREQLLEKGKKILIISEDGSARKGAFDFEQDGVLYYKLKARGEQYVNPINFYMDALNIVDSVKEGVGLGMQQMQSSRKGGQYRFYTNCITNHDYQRRIVCGNRLSIGYQAIFAPFIPIWYIGDEFGATAEKVVLFDKPIDWSVLDQPENAAFFEDVKKMIRIRRQYPAIFQDMPLNHRESNICKVSVEGLSALQAYARYKGKQGILIIPNNEPDKTGECVITIPFSEMGMDANAPYTITDLMTGNTIPSSTQWKTIIPYQNMGVYLIESAIK